MTFVFQHSNQVEHMFDLKFSFIIINTDIYWVDTIGYSVASNFCIYVQHFGTFHLWLLFYFIIFIQCYCCFLYGCCNGVSCSHFPLTFVIVPCTQMPEFLRTMWTWVGIFACVDSEMGFQLVLLSKLTTTFCTLKK